MQARTLLRPSLTVACAALLVAFVDSSLYVERSQPSVRTLFSRIAVAAAAESDLSSLRQRFIGRNVYAFGGGAVSCAPDWTDFYPPSTPLRVIAIRREGGEPVWLGYGAHPWPYVLGPGFRTAHPLRFIFATPRVRPLGTNWGVGGPPGACPAMLLADWQVDITLTTQIPTANLPGIPEPPHLGMSRDEVIWSRGYPNEPGDRRALRAKATWSYEHIVMDYSTITFRNDRVVSFTGFERTPRI